MISSVLGSDLRRARHRPDWLLQRRLGSPARANQCLLQRGHRRQVSSSPARSRCASFSHFYWLPKHKSRQVARHLDLINESHRLTVNSSEKQMLWVNSGSKFNQIILILQRTVHSSEIKDAKRSFASKVKFTKWWGEASLRAFIQEDKITN